MKPHSRSTQPLLILSLMAITTAVSLIAANPAQAQILHATGPRPSFQVATIKPSKPDETVSGMRFSDGGRGFVTTNATLRDLIQEAYNVKSTNQIIGAGGWMTSEKFDIEARLEDAEFSLLAAMPMEQKIDQIRLMVQSLLRERFALSLDESTRQSTFFLLVQAKGGSRLRPSLMAPLDPDGIKVPHPVTGPTLLRKGPGKIEAAGVSMALLSDTLARMPELGGEGGFTIGDLVVDKTGFTGSYDWSLNWTPLVLSQSGDEGVQNNGAPALFTAVQEQLGLKLGKTKGPVEVLVITHVEKPTAN